MTDSAALPAPMVLVDDDFHSARLMMRMLEAHGGPEIVWLHDPAEAVETLAGRATVDAAGRPSLVVVDLKSSSTATAEFIAGLSRLAPGLVVVAMSPTLDREPRTTLLEAGATAVFQRHSELELYRREAASIVSYWVRSQHLDAVGA